MLLRRANLGAAAALCALAALALPSLASAAHSRAEREAARSIVVRFAASVPAARRAQLLARAGATPVRTLRQLGLVVAHVDPAQRAHALAVLRRSGAVRMAEGSHVFHALDTIPTDPVYVTPTEAWPWDTLRLPKAWDTTTGGVLVAVVDTGVRANETDINGRVLAGFNELTQTANTNDDEGHGTTVATSLAGAMNNAFGGVGSCPACTILPVKVLDSTGSGTDVDIANGIVWAASHGAKIINLSLGGSYNDSTIATAIATANSLNVLVVAAAGNSNTTQPSYPAAFPGVLSVAASDENRNLESFSQYGLWVDVAAPGCIHTGDMYNTVSYVCGTSFAAPLTAGVAALALASNPALTNVQLRSLIDTTAMVTSANVHYGVVDAANVFNNHAAPFTIGVGFVAGAAQSGQTLTATLPLWMGSPTLTTAHQWWRCLADGSGCVALAGATGTTYTLTNADIGYRLKFIDTATNPAGSVSQTAPSSEVVVSSFAPAPAPAQPPASVPGSPAPPAPSSGTTSPATAPVSVVVAPSLPPQSPSIVGTAVPGARISAVPGSLDDALGVSVSYTWQVLRGTWKAVPRATDQDFDIPRSFGGLKVRVLVTTRDAAGSALRQSASDPVTVKAPKARLKLKR